MKILDYCYIKDLRSYGIGRILSFEDNNCVIISFKNNTHMSSIGNVISSSNIIDLIEVGDYVNGERVTQVTNAYVEVCYGRDSDEFIKPENIKSIVTKEQFESMEYKVKE